MSRYMNTLSTGRTPDEAQRIINEYLASEGLEYRDERGEMVWRKGSGALASPQFIKTEVSADGVVHIEAWIAGAALLPGVYGGELDPMEGAYGFAVKAALKPRIRELESRLGGTPVAYTAPQQTAVAAGWYADPTGRHEQRYWDGAKWTADVADAGAASQDAEGVA